MLKGRRESDNVATITPRQSRRRAAAALAVVTPLGFLTKFAVPDWLGGSLGRWCNLHGAAVLYEVFWILAVKFVWTRARTWPCAAGVFAATCLLEFLQRLHAPWLDAVRGTFMGAVLLGNGFDWWDFPHYALGCTAGGLVAARVAPVNGS